MYGSLTENVVLHGEICQESFNPVERFYVAFVLQERKFNL